MKTFKQRFEEKGKRSAITFTGAMAALAPIPGMNTYAASKIFTDYVALGLKGELSKYVDVTSWRAAGVSTKIIGSPKTNLIMASPETYVNHAFSKMRSGIHSGYFGHEIPHLVWTNLNDVLPISACAYFWNMLLTRKFKEKAEREAAEKKAS